MAALTKKKKTTKNENRKLHKQVVLCLCIRFCFFSYFLCTYIYMSVCVCVLFDILYPNRLQAIIVKRINYCKELKSWEKWKKNTKNFMKKAHTHTYPKIKATKLHSQRQAADRHTKISFFFGFFLRFLCSFGKQIMLQQQKGLGALKAKANVCR